MNRRVVLGYLAIAIPVAFLWLGGRDVHVMEGIVADGASHMARTHEYVVPHLYEEVYNYKPPLSNWMALASTRVWGAESEWALRFPFALSGVLMGLAVLWLVGSALDPRTGFLSAIASLTGALVVRKLQLAEFDMPLAAGVGVAVAATCSNLAMARPTAWRWLVAYAGLALGFLAKGLPALMLFGPGLVAAVLWTGRWRELFTLRHIIGVVLFLVVGGGWVWAAIAAEGAAAFTQPLQEAGEKSLQWTPAAVARALAKPLVVLTLFLPWTILLPLALRRTWWLGLDSTRMGMARCAAAFAVCGTLVFTVVPAEQTRYFLPLCVPLGILCGMLVEPEPGRSGLGRAVRYAAFGLAALLGLAAIIVPLRPDPVAFGARLLAPLAGLATLGWAGFAWKRQRGTASVLVAAGVVFWLVNAAVVEPARAEKRSLRSVAAAFAKHLPEDGPIWTTPVDKEFRHSSLLYYLRRPVRTVTDRHLPQPGSYVVLFSDEPADRPGYELPADYSVVARGERRGVEFTLVRVEDR